MKDIIRKIVRSLKYFVLLIKRVSQTIENETKEQRDRFLGMLLDTLDADLLGSVLADQGVIADCNGIHRAGQGFSAASSKLRNKE